MLTQNKPDCIRRSGDKKNLDSEGKPKSVPENPSLRYIFYTSFILVVVYSYIYPHLFPKQSKKSLKMMTSRTSRYSHFAGAISEKVQNDRFWLEGDKSHWYRAEVSQIPISTDGDEDFPNEDNPIMATFVQMDSDDETKRFIVQSVEKSDQLLTQMWHNLAKMVLKRFFGYTQTDINGYLQRGSMFVMSTQQFVRLREKAGIESNVEEAEGSLVDLGAGDGRPTESLRPFYKNVYATEASWAMRNILSDKGIDVLEIDEWHIKEGVPGKYDTISCLNLLDRCEQPLSLLRRIKAALKPDGFLLVALVLPFKPYVEWNSNHQPSETLLPISPEDQQTSDSSHFEQQLPSLFDMFHSEGFVVNAWTRLPYLCEGDMGQSIYVLSDAVFLCSLKDK